METTPSRPRNCKRETEHDPRHWEVFCKNIPEAGFIQRFRLTRAQFQQLLSLLEENITPQQTFAHDAIPADKRLAITLRYLATGSDVTLVGDSFGVPERTVPSQSITHA